MSALSELLTEANVGGLSIDKITDRMHELGHGIGRDTVWKYMTGRHARVRTQYLRAFADVFPSLTVREMQRAAAVPADLGDWHPPAEANSLNQREREALEVLIKSLARGKVASTPADVTSLRVVEAHQDIPEAAIERNPGGTPPGQSEESDT